MDNTTNTPLPQDRIVAYHAYVTAIHPAGHTRCFFISGDNRLASVIADTVGAALKLAGWTCDVIHTNIHERDREDSSDERTSEMMDEIPF